MLCSLATTVLALIFMAFLLQRFRYRRGIHQLTWAIGMSFYGLGAFCQFLMPVAGQNADLFRLWYLFGAFLTAAWLGQGTLFLLASRRIAMSSLVLLIIGAIYAAMLLFATPFDATKINVTGQLTGIGVLPDSVSRQTIPFNTYGTILLVGGAIYSTWHFWRRRILLGRLTGNVLIMIGGLSPALGGVYNRLGIQGILYPSQLLGLALIFLGFVQASILPPDDLDTQAEETENIQRPS